ncbi:hypothetical protein Rcae01_00733 [Novipirellula caenicola]|uniref:Uncharacterized protein n=1 Tax=Novipirellula caenicola TaxID=1536901 RepID=A0ABP9VJB3_9BACT
MNRNSVNHYTKGTGCQFFEEILPYAKIPSVLYGVDRQDIREPTTMASLIRLRRLASVRVQSSAKERQFIDVPVLLFMNTFA